MSRESNLSASNYPRRNMPHRLLPIHAALSHLLEGAILAVLTGSQMGLAMLDAITSQDWERLTGPHGVAFVACLSTMVLWGTMVAMVHRFRKDSTAKEARDRADALAREEREREDRKAHFEELRTSNKENVERLLHLTEQHQKLTVEAATIDMRVSHSISKLETAISNLSDNFSSCPANLKNKAP